MASNLRITKRPDDEKASEAIPTPEPALPAGVPESGNRVDLRLASRLCPRMRLTVNGGTREVAAPDSESLATTLRDRLFLTGTKIACDRGECGACTVLLDGEPVYSCITLTAACEGRAVVTVEGVAAHHHGAAGHVSSVPLHPVQQAFIDCDAVQCGFCTPGQIVSAVALLERTAAPDESAIAEAMSGNLCRCGTYPKIAQAIRLAAQRMAQGSEAPR